MCIRKLLKFRVFPKIATQKKLPFYFNVKSVIKLPTFGKPEANFVMDSIIIKENKASVSETFSHALLP